MLYITTTSASNASSALSIMFALLFEPLLFERAVAASALKEQT